MSNVLGRLAVAAALMAALSGPSLGQTTFPTANGSSVPGAVMMCLDSATGLAAPVLVSGGTCPGSGGGTAGNITQWNSVALGSPSQFGTTPGAVNVPGVNAAIISSALPTGASSSANQSSALAKLDTLISGVTSPIPDCGASPCTNNIGLVQPAGGQKTVATSFSITQPSDPDTRPATGTITVQDTGSTTSSGQNSVTIYAGTPTANSFQTQAINGASTARVQLTGTWTGTLMIQGSMDSGTTWISIPCRNVGSPYTTATVTANGMFDCDVSGLTNIRVTATAAMTGTATVRFTISSIGGPVQVLNPIRLVDNTTGASATIKPASTAPATTDTSVPVAAMPNLHASTTALANSLVVSAAPAYLSGFNCTAITGGSAGYCVAYNGTSAPGTGALTGSLVLDFCYYAAGANGCSLSRIPSSILYATGIVLLLTSAASPYTYTTGTNTAAMTADYKL